MGIAWTLAVSIGVLVGVVRKQVANGVAYEKDSLKRIKKHMSYFPGTGPNVEAANVTDADIHWMAETPNGSLPDLIRVLASRR